MSIDPTVYIGAPISGYTATAEDDKDAFGIKIGGRPAWLRPVVATPEVSGAEAKASLNRCARCPKCRSAAHLRLLSQIHAPLDIFDRILYLFMCVACSTPQESVVCAFRSQLYNPSYDDRTSAPVPPVGEAAGPKDNLFAVDDDDGWGNDADDTPAPAPVHTPVVPEPVAAAKLEVYPMATAADNAAFIASMKMQPLPIVVLDTFPEPEGEKDKTTNKSVGEQLAEVEALYPGITEVSNEAVEADKLPTGGSKGGSATTVVDDDGPVETPDEVAAAEFMTRVARWPSQCIRWNPQGQPLLSSATKRPPANIPACSTCGAQRVFEFQLLSPSVYFFEKYATVKSQTRKKVAEPGSKASKMETIMAVEGSAEDPHFSTISVFTCSRHCYDAAHTVTLEYAHLEPEL